VAGKRGKLLSPSIFHYHVWGVMSSDVIKNFVFKAKKKKKKILHRELGPLRGSSSPFGALRGRELGLNPIKLAYRPSRPDGQL